MPSSRPDPGGARPRIALATKNPGKHREILQICADWPVDWVLDSEDPGWPEVAETSSTYLENALLKARAVVAYAGIAALADDSGIEVDALGGAPGPRSARFAGKHATDAGNLALLIRRIREVPERRRGAQYRCLVACIWPDGREAWAEGVCRGRLILEPRGTAGFGYDPIFVPEGEVRTMAELPPPEKNAISHRGRALRSIREAVLRGP